MSPLRDDLVIHNQNYKTWREKYLSPLPILSADCIDAYVRSLNHASVNARKSTSSIAAAVSKGSWKLIGELIERSCMDQDSRDFWKNSLETFPFLQETSLMEKYFFGDSSEQPPALEADPQKIASLNYLLQKLRRMREKYRNMTDFGRLINSYELTDTSNNLQIVEKERLINLSARLKTLKTECRNQPWLEEDAFRILKNQIDIEIDAEIRSVTEELARLNAP